MSSHMSVFLYRPAVMTGILNAVVGIHWVTAQPVSVGYTIQCSAAGLTTWATLVNVLSAFPLKTLTAMTSSW